MYNIGKQWRALRTLFEVGEVGTLRRTEYVHVMYICTVPASENVDDVPVGRCGYS